MDESRDNIMGKKETTLCPGNATLKVCRQPFFFKKKGRQPISPTHFESSNHPKVCAKTGMLEKC